MPQPVYSEEHPGLRWPTVAIAIAGWSLMIGCGIAMNVPHLEGLVVLAVIGGLLGLIYTVYLIIGLAVSIRVYDDSIQIGGLRGRDRRLRRGTWPPQKLNAGMQRKAVFTCPWQAADGLYVLTERSDIKRVRQDLKQYMKSTRGVRLPLGVFNAAGSFADAHLLISNDPNRAASEPREFGPLRGQNGRMWPVASPTWLVPIQNPDAFRAALRRLPQAPPVYDRLPEGHIRFEVG